MDYKAFTLRHCTVGRTAAWSVFFFGVAYAVTTILGFLSLKSPDDPIADPYFTIMELLIILIALLMVLSMVTFNGYGPPETKVYSLMALIFMIIMSGITSSVHFAILTVGRQLEAIDPELFSLLLSFKWPSIAYTLDILAWDWFFALSMLFAAFIFRGGSKLESMLRILMIVSGILSLVGLIGVPLANMQVRNIGIIGYGLVAPFVFLLLGVVFGRSKQTQSSDSKV